MSKLGGYQIVNFADVNLTDTGVTFKGLYARLFKNIGKPVLLSGVVLFNKSYQDCYVQPVYTLDGFKMTVGDSTVTVTSNDLVLAAEGIVGGGGGGSDIPPLNPEGAGEVLTNIGSETMGWVANHDVPNGGTTGQVLTKASSENQALKWATPVTHYPEFRIVLNTTSELDLTSGNTSEMGPWVDINNADLASFLANLPTPGYEGLIVCDSLLIENVYPNNEWSLKGLGPVILEVEAATSTRNQVKISTDRIIAGYKDANLFFLDGVTIRFIPETGKPVATGTTMPATAF